MDRTIVVLLLVIIAIASLIASTSWFSDERTTLQNKTSSEISAAKNIE